jgi:hypothetical protein
MANPGDPPPTHEHGAPTTSGHAAATAAPPFPEDEWRSFRAVDTTAAAYIVGLMAGIFSVGLVLYLFVFFTL